LIVITKEEKKLTAKAQSNPWFAAKKEGEDKKNYIFPSVLRTFGSASPLFFSIAFNL
jgi:hypothetical protein